MTDKSGTVLFDVLKIVSIFSFRLRDRFNSPGLSVVEDAALLLYLNKTAFNGLYRVNTRGEFNVPFGRYKNPVVVNERRIREASRVLAP